MSNLKLIPKDGPERCKLDAIEMLNWAKEQGFESVIIFGFKNDAISHRSSKVESRLTVMGALTAAQQELWNVG